MFPRVALVSFPTTFRKQHFSQFYQSCSETKRKKKKLSKERNKRRLPNAVRLLGRRKKDCCIFRKVLTNAAATRTRNIFLSRCPSIPASQVEKRATKRTIEEYLTFDLFLFPYPWLSRPNVPLVRFDTPLTYVIPIFSIRQVSYLFSICITNRFDE